MIIKLHDLRQATGSKIKRIRVGRGEGSKGKTAGRHHIVSAGLDAIIADHLVPEVEIRSFRPELGHRRPNFGFATG